MTKLNKIYLKKKLMKTFISGDHVECVWNFNRKWILSGDHIEC